MQHTLGASFWARNAPGHFAQQYQSHLNHLNLEALQPKTIDACARCVRRIGEYFSHQVAALSADPLTDCFTDLMASHSCSGASWNRYGWKFFNEHVLRKPWAFQGRQTRPGSAGSSVDDPADGPSQRLLRR